MQITINFKFRYKYTYFCPLINISNSPLSLSFFLYFKIDRGWEFISLERNFSFFFHDFIGIIKLTCFFNDRTKTTKDKKKYCFHCL